MAAKRDSKLSKQLLRELTYNGINIVYAHGQFNNSLPSQIPTKKYLERLISIFDVDIFNLNVHNGCYYSHQRFRHTTRLMGHLPL